MARAPALFFRLELADAIVYKTTTAFVDFNFTFLFINADYSLFQWLVNGATPPCKQAKVDSNTEDHYSLSEPSGSQSKLPGKSSLLTIRSQASQI